MRLLTVLVIMLPHTLTGSLADEPIRVDDTELPEAIQPWFERLDGLAVTIEISRQLGDAPMEVSLIDVSQLQLDVWRSDFSGGSRVRDGQFWFAVVETDGGYRFDRLGFMNESVAAEEQIPTTNGYLDAATHVLDIPLPEFVALPGLKIAAHESPTRDTSQHRIRWEIDAVGGVRSAARERHCRMVRRQWERVHFEV